LRALAPLPPTAPAPSVRPAAPDAARTPACRAIPHAALTTALALALALGPGLGLAGCTQPSPPDVLLVTLDTTRADRLGPYGHTGARTPALDGLARDAFLYERAYAPSSWTLPSHASLFTGLLPMQHGAQTAPEGDAQTLGYTVRPLAERFATLAERLAAAGYQTAAVVAGPALRRELGVAQGFAHYDDDLSGPARAVHGRRAEEVADAAIARLASFDAGPWFLFVNFFDPHAPYRPPPPFDAGVPDADTGRLTAALVERLAADAGDPAAPRPSWQERALAAMRAGYDAEIAYMDHHLGRLLDAALAGPRGDATLVVVTSDHGESFGEHDYVSHGAHLYEDNVRVPLIVRPPGGGPGERVARPVPNRAVFAEILAAAGLAPPPTAPRLDAPPPRIATEVGASDANVRLFGSFFDRRLHALYEPPWKLIVSSRGDLELYHLARDPAETRDLHASEPDTTRRLRRTLDEVVRAHPPLYDADARAELDPDTERALRELGYLAD